MIFKQWRQVLAAMKTQMRPIVKEGDNVLFDGWPPILAVWDKTHRLRWEVGRTYAVQPGPGQKAVGRIRITGIRRERLRIINNADIEAEGICLKYNRNGECGWSNGLDGLLYVRREWAFKALWDSINKKPGTRWADDPEVWPLTFEVVR